MTLYEIDQQIIALVDMETGEILDFDAFEALQMEKHQKLESIALWVKNLDAEIEALRAEEKSLAARRKQKQAQQERLRSHLNRALAGEKFESARCCVGYRSSEAVEVLDESAFIEWAQVHAPSLLTFEPKIKKNEIAAQIKEGEKVPYATLVQRKNMNIK